MGKSWINYKKKFNIELKPVLPVKYWDNYNKKKMIYVENTTLRVKKNQDKMEIITKKVIILKKTRTTYEILG